MPPSKVWLYNFQITILRTVLIGASISHKKFLALNFLETEEWEVWTQYIPIPVRDLAYRCDSCQNHQPSRLQVKSFSLFTTLVIVAVTLNVSFNIAFEIVSKHEYGSSRWDSCPSDAVDSFDSYQLCVYGEICIYQNSSDTFPQTFL